MKSEIKHKKLGEIAEVTAGYAFRSALRPDSSGNMAIFQVKDVRKGLWVDDSQLIKIQMDYQGDRLLKKGDVLLSGRGFFEAAIFSSNEKAVATSSVYVLRSQRTLILPEYLAIFLNSRAGQGQIKRYQTNTTIKSILKNDLMKIAVPLLGIKEQRTVAEFYQAKNRHQALLKRKIELYNQLFEQSLRI